MDEITVVDNQLSLPEKVTKELKKLREFQITKAEMDIEESKIRDALLKAMSENGIKGFENDDVKIIFKDATTRRSVDRNALKEQGLYDRFLKESPVKASVSISYKDQ